MIIHLHGDGMTHVSLWYSLTATTTSHFRHPRTVSLSTPALPVSDGPKTKPICRGLDVQYPSSFRSNSLVHSIMTCIAWCESLAFSFLLALSDRTPNAVNRWAQAMNNLRNTWQARWPLAWMVPYSILSWFWGQCPLSLPRVSYAMYSHSAIGEISSSFFAEFMFSTIVMLIESSITKSSRFSRNVVGMKLSRHRDENMT